MKKRKTYTQSTLVPCVAVFARELHAAADALSDVLSVREEAWSVDATAQHLMVQQSELLLGRILKRAAAFAAFRTAPASTIITTHDLEVSDVEQAWETLMQDALLASIK